MAHRGEGVTGASARRSAPVDERCVNLAAMPSPQEYLSDEVLDAAVLEAQRLAFVVHEYDRDQVCRIVKHLADTDQTRAVLVVLAAMVDIDRPVSELLGWVLAIESEQESRKPWERVWYPQCDPAADGSPAGCGSRHGTPARHTAGCRGAGCRLARKDYDAWRLYGRTPE